jgi:hypothetical protein
MNMDYRDATRNLSNDVPQGLAHLADLIGTARIRLGIDRAKFMKLEG